jgi:hypothetical protein
MELKPCPFCGSDRIEIYTKKMKVSGLPSKEKAIEAWNRRAENDTN